MSINLLALLLLLPCSGLLWLLAWRDPKRLRAHRITSRQPWRTRQRQKLGLLLFAPLLPLLMLGAWSAVLIWLGGLLILGWLMALGFSWRR